LLPIAQSLRSGKAEYDRYHTAARNSTIWHGS
jgi:hypothetical protein